MVWSGPGRFALSFHTTSTFVGAGVTWLGKYQERGAACRGKKERKMSSLSPLLSGSYCSDRVSSSNLRRKSSYCISSNAHRVVLT